MVDVVNIQHVRTQLVVMSASVTLDSKLKANDVSVRY